MAAEKDKTGSVRSKTIAAPQPQTRADNGIITLRYEETLPQKPPLAVTVPPPRAPPTDIHPALRTPRTNVEDKDESKRDSGLAPTTSSKAREGSVNTVDENILGIKIDFNSNITSASSQPLTQKDVPGTPTPKVVKSSSVRSGSMPSWKKPGSRKNSTPRTPSSRSMEEEFSPITTPIPTDGLMDGDFLEQISFSKRGSMMLGGRKAINGHARPQGGRRYA